MWDKRVQCPSEGGLNSCSTSTCADKQGSTVKRSFLESLKSYKIFVAHLIFVLSCFSIVGWTTTYQNRNPIGEVFPSVQGNALDNTVHFIPEILSAEKTLLLIGYIQNTQFDIDRWLIGLDQTKTKVKVYELPTIQGWFPRIFQRRIDNFMRSGIPNELWGGVVTIYKDAETIQKFTGNVNPINARVILVGEGGEVIFFYDRGFSVKALNTLRMAIDSL